LFSFISPSAVSHCFSNNKDNPKCHNIGTVWHRTAGTQLYTLQALLGGKKKRKERKGKEKKIKKREGRRGKERKENRRKESKGKERKGKNRKEKKRKEKKQKKRKG